MARRLRCLPKVISIYEEEKFTRCFAKCGRNMPFWAIAEQHPCC
jgi:hypothetical protein